MKRPNLLLVIIFVLVLSGTGVTRSGGVETTGAFQDPASLDRRISMLEQRFYAVESNIRRLESVVSARPSQLSDSARTDSVVLRSEIEILKSQMQLINCAIAKLDERTLPAKQRQSERENSFKDPCRMNPETPLNLPTQR
jgi:hypothetical protein